MKCEPPLVLLLWYLQMVRMIPTKNQGKVGKSGREMYFLYTTLGIHTAISKLKALTGYAGEKLFKIFNCI